MFWGETIINYCIWYKGKIDVQWDIGLRQNYSYETFINRFESEMAKNCIRKYKELFSWSLISWGLILHLKENSYSYSFLFPFTAIYYSQRWVEICNKDCQRCARIIMSMWRQHRLTPDIYFYLLKHTQLQLHNICKVC